MLEAVAKLLSSGQADVDLQLLAASGQPDCSAVAHDSGNSDGIHYASNNVRMAASLRLDCDGRATHELAYESYNRVLRHFVVSGYRHVWRVWCILPNLECYQEFNQGRAMAYSRHSVKIPCFPAATVVDNGGSSFILYAIAGTTAARHIENLRQCSAYRYPSAYGNQPPQFCRAVAVPWDGSSRLLLSGTASIVGHKTMHEGRLLQQMDEILHNVDTMAYSAGAGKALYVNAYLRHSEDSSRVMPVMQRVFPDARLCLYKAGMCRSGLVLEMDGVWV